MSLRISEMIRQGYWEDNWIMDRKGVQRKLRPLLSKGWKLDDRPKIGLRLMHKTGAELKIGNKGSLDARIPEYWKALMKRLPNLSYNSVVREGFIGSHYISTSVKDFEEKLNLYINELAKGKYEGSELHSQKPDLL